MPAKESVKRERDIYLRLQRDPKGAILKRDKAPVGLRTPNGFVWGHQVEHIFWMPRIPGTNALTVWSRSMLKAFGEGYNDSDWKEPLVPPRVLRPWPVLRIQKQSGDGDDPEVTLNAIDQGCDDEHKALKRAKEEESKAEAEVQETTNEFSFMALMGDCPFDPEEICTGPVLFNTRDAKDTEGRPYSFLWCEHFRSMMLKLPDPQSVMVAAVAVTGSPCLDADTTGIRVKGVEKPMEESKGKDKIGRAHV